MNKYYVGFLIMVVLTSSIYVMLPDNVRIDIKPTKSIFQVYEDDNWVIAGIEWVNLFDGTKKMRAKSRDVINYTEDEYIIIKRNVLYKDNITVNETYTFISNSTDVKLFPVNHEIMVNNGQGKILQYDVTDLLYSGETTKGISSPQNFGHKMKVEWDYGNYYSKIYKYKYKDEGKLTVKYRVSSDNETYNVRLFDPIEFIVTLNSPIDNYNTADNTPDFNFTVTGSEGIYSCELFLNDTGYGVNGTTLNDTATIITANASIPDSVYNWNINCTNETTVNSSEIREITIDTIPPQITVYTPENITYYDISEINLNWSVNEILSNQTYNYNGGNNISNNSWYNLEYNWSSNNTIIGGLVDSGTINKPNVFYMDSTWYLIVNFCTGGWFGYNWTGSTWQSDSNIINGIPVIYYSKPSVFEKDSTWYLIVGESTGNWFGYNWTGSTWQVDSNIIDGLTDVGDLSSPNVFYMNSTWYLISGSITSGWFGWNWTGSTWQSDSGIKSGITGANHKASDSFEKNNIWYLIAGDINGDFHGYNWTGSTWQVDTEITEGLTDIGQWSTPTTFYMDETWYLISGNGNGDWYGFKENTYILNFKTDLNYLETLTNVLTGNNNVTIYATDLIENINSTTIYFYMKNTSIIVNYTSGDYLEFLATSYDGTFPAIGQNDTIPGINITNVGNVNLYINVTVNTTQESCMTFWMSEDATLNRTVDYNVTDTAQTIISYLNTDGWCYQETANVSTICGGLDTGTYSSDTTDSYFYINYTKMSQATLGSIWMYKVGATTYNITIPSGCWGYSDILQLKVYGSSTQTGTLSFSGYCKNSTAWDLMWTNASTWSIFNGVQSLSGCYDGDWDEECAYHTATGYWKTNSNNVLGFYEEAMWWNMTKESDYLWCWMIFDQCTPGTQFWYDDYYDSFES